jgi:general secretion pathway protein A
MFWFDSNLKDKYYSRHELWQVQNHIISKVDAVGDIHIQFEEQIMYEEFYGLKQLPFQLLPDPDFFYRSNKHEKALTYLEYGIFERAGFIVITGEIGTGKTTLLRYILRSLNKDLPIVLLNQTLLNPEDLLRALCQEFSLPYEAKGKSELLELFGTFLVDQYRKGNYVILILDEAQNLPLDTLEEIRMLSNLDADTERLLQIILVGQPTLRKKLQRKELRQFLQRIEVSYHLEALDRDEIKAYIHYRLKTAGIADPELFGESAIEVIYDYTAGVPRLINLVCHRSLVYGFADTQKKINADLVKAMLKDREAEGIITHADSSENDEGTTKKLLESEESAETNISQAHLAETLNRLIDISNTSMKAVEWATAKAVNATLDVRLTALKEQLSEEKKAREALEHKLIETEAALFRVEKALSRIFGEEIDGIRSGTDHNQIRPTPSTHLQNIKQEKTRNASDSKILRSWTEHSMRSFTKYIRKTKALIIRAAQRIIESLNTLFSRWLPILLNEKHPAYLTKARRYRILCLVVTITFLSAVVLTVWRFEGSRTSQLRIDDEAAVFEDNMQRADTKQDGTGPNQTMPIVTSRTNDKDNIRASDDSTNLLHLQSNNPSTRPVSSDRNQTPVGITAKNLTGDNHAVSGQNSTKTYVCVVNLANIRARPDTSAPVLRRISRGTQVRVIGRKGNWMRLKNDDGKIAWVYHGLLRPLD